MKRLTGRQRALLAGALLLLTVVLVRVIMAAFGQADPGRVAGEAGVLITVVGVGAAVMGSPRAWLGWRAALSGLLLLVLGAGVVFPMVTLAHPSQPLFDGNIGEARRRQSSEPAGKSATYELTLGPPRNADSSLEGRGEPARVLVRTRAGDLTLTSERKASAPELFDLELQEGEKVELTLEQGGGWLGVLLRRPVLDWQLVRILAIIAAVLGVVVDLVGARGKTRGLIAGSTLAAALYVIQLDAASPPDGGKAFAAAALALTGAALWAAIVGGPLRRLTKPAP